jgi:predicted small secreted protein
MKKLISILMALVLVLSACNNNPSATLTGSGKMVKQSFDLKDFDQIRIGTSGVLYLQQGNDFGLTVEADDNILPVLEIGVEKGVLTVRTRPEVSRLQLETLIYRVTLPALSLLEISGSADVRAEDFSSDSLTIRINGSGNVTFAHLNAQSLAARLSGSGDLILPDVTAKSMVAEINDSGQMEASGETESLTVRTSGSGELLAEKLKATIVDVEVNGSGNATVWAIDRLDVSISGSGDVRYLGLPELTEKISGGGELIALDAR